MMTLYQPLPKQLYSNISKDIPSHIVERLNFLWKSAYECLLSSSITISHRLSHSFMKLIYEHDITLPDTYMQQICKYCLVLHVPTVTYIERIRRVSKSSKNLASKSSDLKNTIIRLCLICKKTINLNIGFSKRKEIKVASSTVSNQPFREPIKSPPKKFSFHETLQRRITTSTVSSIISSTGLPSNDFISLSSFDSTIKDISNNKRFLTLLEREQLKKKIRKHNLIPSDNSLREDKGFMDSDCNVASNEGLVKSSEVLKSSVTVIQKNKKSSAINEDDLLIDSYSVFKQSSSILKRKSEIKNESSNQKSLGSIKSMFSSNAKPN